MILDISNNAILIFPNFIYKFLFSTCIIPSTEYLNGRQPNSNHHDTIIYSVVLLETFANGFIDIGNERISNLITFKYRLQA